jgi:predicted unusual protein kinase regulating ubiquinone biosynthesis (AarF/ABC1/UbiB family)
MNKVGIIHHDLHNGNVMVSKSGKVFIIDYDFAGFYKDEESEYIDRFNQDYQLNRDDSLNILSLDGIAYIYNTLVKEKTLIPPRIVAGKTRKAKRS